MVIFWRRWGILVVVLGLLGMGTGLLIYSGLQGLGIAERHSDGLAHRSENLFVGLGWMIGGGYVWLFDRYVNRTRLDKPRLYKQTVMLDPPRPLPDGELQLSYECPVLAPPPESTLLFIPFRYWWIILVALGGVVIVINAFRGTF